MDSVYPQWYQDMIQYNFDSLEAYATRTISENHYQNQALMLLLEEDWDQPNKQYVSAGCQKTYYLPAPEINRYQYQQDHLENIE